MERSMDNSINIPLKLINATNISSECKFFLIHIIANHETNIHMPTIIKDFKSCWGKDRIYNLLSEALDSGYITRNTTYDLNLKRYSYELNI